MKIVEEIYNLLNKIYTNKGTTSYIDIDQFTEVVKQASRQKYDETFKSWQLTQEITDDMRPFLVDPTPLILTNGIAPYPANYHHLAQVTYGVMDDEADIVDTGSFAARRNSELMQPDKYPICKLRSTNIEFHPKVLSGVKITYFKLPTDPIIPVSYASGREVIDWANCTDLEWRGDSVNSITNKVLESFGVNMKDADLIQFSQANKEEK